MIVDVELYGQIRRMFTQEGMTQRAISRTLSISRNTVKKHCEGNHVPWDRKPYERISSVVAEEIRAFIQECLDQDQAEGLKNQSHTARQIYHRLKREKAFTGGESTIRNIVNEMRPKHKEAFMPLEFDPGEAAQVDWGEATVYIKGNKTKVQLSVGTPGLRTVRRVLRLQGLGV
ncbi:hypothetical protein [Anoxynatronum buryatiense]|uniref:Transposase n=1 Tax=Anoxynatronum buryatiense TaxID=489973 RepID=A0AA45WSR7_9CLOT|nr:hypothetical protein [Anoxynatronum buryatiense]SMP38746.1 hypothetical protein SAMN06296020_101145 [Anoxynatronum buryatiense]